MAYLQVSSSMGLLVVAAILTMAFANSTRRGEKIHYPDASESGELVMEQRGEQSRVTRNNRGRGVGHQKHNTVPEFEQGIPGIYPLRGPPQAPLVLPPHLGKAVGLQNHKPQQPSQAQTPLKHPYANNPFLSKIPIASITPTANKTTPAGGFPAVTNQLTNSDKPVTTTPSYANPRRTDLLYGSNLLEEEKNRATKAEETSEISFTDRGLFDTAPHCQSGQILVKHKCRMAV